MSLKGKTAVITGGASGIGFATARNYLKQEARNVVLLDICDNKENIQQLKDEFGQANVVFILTDITKRDVVEQTFKRILERFQQIDIVVNCAGVACEKDLERTININLVFRSLFRADWPHQYLVDCYGGDEQGKGGTIVNVSSVAGLIAAPGFPFYNASKHGVIVFTRSMANDCYLLKHGVKFIIICPGMTETPLVEKVLAPNSFVDEQFRDQLNKLIECAPRQTADQCGKSISILTASAQNGTIWILEAGETREVSIPNYWEHAEV